MTAEFKMLKKNQKQRYASPELVCYGKVSDLTLVKSTGSNEGAKGSAVNRKAGKAGFKILPGMDGGPPGN